MLGFGKKISRWCVPIFIIGLVLLIPAFFGYTHTKVNYDLLTYLPEEIDTIKGQDILVDEFGTGAFSLFIVDSMKDKDVAALKEKIEKVEGVKNVIWYDSFMDISVPKEFLPDKVYDMFNEDTSTMLAIVLDDTSSSDRTMEAITQIRRLCNEQCFVSGMTAVIIDTRDLTEKESPLYVGIAVILSAIVLAIFMDSFLIPLIFLVSIGMAILYNLGTNLFLGEISYVTKAVAAVLQLGVTMDYSIFLWNSYKEEKMMYADKKEAMAHAIASTVTSVLGSSVTTIAGFLALCFMSFTLGLDLGIVMAKGVLIGVICCVTVLPSMILIFDKPIRKTSHRQILPNFEKLSRFIVKHYKWIVVIFVILMIPALYGYNNTSVYYNLDKSLPRDLDSIVANTKLDETFHMNTTEMILVDSELSAKEVKAMTNQIDDLDGVKFVLGLDSVTDGAIPDDMIPSSIKEVMESGNYKMLLLGSEYKVASDEVNAQCEKINQIIKSYDENAMLVGEAPCTKDLIDITAKDFANVSLASIGIIFLIILVVFRSVSLPVILVAVIEFAIFINLGIPYYTGTTLPFVANIIISTIQLGATVDYAILMTTKYKQERWDGADKEAAVINAHKFAAPSVIISALSFFAATFGVGLYSNVDIVGSLCNLMARGAIISMVVVIFVLPAMFMIFDKVICHTSMGFVKKERKQKVKTNE